MIENITDTCPFPTLRYLKGYLIINTFNRSVAKLLIMGIGRIRESS